MLKSIHFFYIQVKLISAIYMQSDKLQVPYIGDCMDMDWVLMYFYIEALTRSHDRGVGRTS